MTQRAPTAEIAAVFRRIQERLRQISTGTWLLAAIGLIAVALRAAPLGAFSTEYDEGVYIQALMAMRHGYGLYASIFFPQPPFFAYAIYPFFLAFGQSLPAARVGVAVWSLLAIIGVYLIAKALASRWVGIVAALALTLDQFFTSSSQRLQAEAPALGFGALGLGLVLESAQHMGRKKQALMLAGGALLGLGISTKLFILALLAPAFLYAAAPLLTSMLDRAGRPQLPQRDWLRLGLTEAWPDLALLSAGLFATLLVVWGPFIASGAPIWDQVVTYHDVAASQGRPLTNLGVMVDLLTWGNALRLWFLLAVAGSLAIAYRAWSSLPIWLWLVAACVELLRLSPLFGHHLSVFSPPLAVLTGLAAWHIIAFPQSTLSQARVRGSAVPRFVALGILLASVLGEGVVSAADMASTMQASSPERVAMALDLQQVSRLGDEVVSDDPYVVTLAGRAIPPQLTETSHTRIATGYLTSDEVERIISTRRVHAVLFASGRFDTLPGLRAWVEARFVRVAQFPDGNALYIVSSATPGPV